MHQKDTEWFAFLYLCGERDRDLLLGKVKMIAVKNKRSTNKEIEYVLEQYVKAYEQEHPAEKSTF